jgi:hypothetical protein
MKFQIGKSYIYNGKNGYNTTLIGTKMLITSLGIEPEVLMTDLRGYTCAVIDENGSNHSLYLDELDYHNSRQQSNRICRRAKNKPLVIKDTA